MNDPLDSENRDIDCVPGEREENLGHAVSIEWDEDPENPEADLKYHISSF